MIELQTSNGNALALYSLLSGGKGRGRLAGEIRRRNRYVQV